MSDLHILKKRHMDDETKKQVGASDHQSVICFITFE